MTMDSAWISREKNFLKRTGHRKLDVSGATICIECTEIGMQRDCIFVIYYR